MRLGALFGILLPCLLLASPLQAAEPRISIEGLESVLADNVRLHLGIAREPCDFPAWRERGLLGAVDEQARTALRAFGFYQPVIEQSFERDQDCWELRLNIDSGPQVRVRGIDAQVLGAGADDPSFQQVIDTLSLSPGAPLRHDEYEQVKRALNRVASERGYFEAHFIRSALLVHVGDSAADIELHMDTGPRYRFGPVTLDQDSLHDDLVRRFITFEQGDPFDIRPLIQLQQAYIDSRYFAQVRVDPRVDDSKELEVPIQVSMTRRNRWTYVSGLGFSTDTGPRLRLGVENHRANARGHRYNADTELSPVRSNIGINYEIPRGDPARERISLTGGIQTENTDTSDSDRLTLGVAHVIQKPSGWVHTRFVRYEYEQFTVGNVRDSSSLLMPGYGISRVVSDHPVFPRRGWRLSGEVRGAAEYLASNVSFAQAVGKARWITPVGPGRLLLRGEAGTTLMDDIDALPPSLRFFAGGDSSIRGYGFQRLGPTDNQGDVIGGKHLLVGSVELEWPIRGNWSMAGFVDGGNAFDQISDLDAQYGIGAGIRWRSPIGPIRFDVAAPSDGPDSYRIHLTMGMDL